MHPQLDDKKLVCKDFIQALEQCHSNSWARLTGGCNKYKDAMNACLHRESTARSARNRENAKERKVKREEAMKAFLQD
ncbi:hypothetical protein GYMLUDRAFT_44101 [Collybiopsis luxurians FD-317 M1]|uniref:COX assembly mitochondrial protein n=1 Tax=Collybiopsis luxurians FD-317 M1 TaxID=944289 RepID=A0A0D0CM45_9AGAR|nr:hypothetical protein GYMLUDRAFT_44101 [Collybiopsis luxurians FD-317 M1]